MYRLKLQTTTGSPQTAILLITLIVCLLITACVSKPNHTPATLRVTLIVDNQQIQTLVPSGSSVQNAIEKANIQLNPLDKVDPPTFTVIENPIQIKITRVTEEFILEEKVIPFERQTVRNEALPAGQTMLIQPGLNGVQQITYRILRENGVEVSRSIFKVTTLTESNPEIVMVGVQTPFTAIPIPGKLAYLTSGNAWIMENTTGERRPLITTGDLDGRVFSLSENGEWLLFTRKATGEDAEKPINTLWMINTSEQNAKAVYLRVQNIVHFADWVPGLGLTISYSTVEPRPTAPGWQANNDLYIMTVNERGGIIRKEKIIEENSGGVYGWWGTHYSWSPNGQQLAYARPDSIGIVDIEETQLIPLLDIIPLQTRSDWAWVPGLGWSSDSNFLYTVNHVANSSLTSAEESPDFDLSVILLQDRQVINMVPQTGMFAYPSPAITQYNKHYPVAFLIANFPEQSESSRYRLAIMDRDGSNRKIVFPEDGAVGINPQKVIWSPHRNPEETQWIALIQAGNLWLFNPSSSQAQQITGDGSIVKMDWK